jgi:hypothetical protein
MGLGDDFVNLNERNFRANYAIWFASQNQNTTNIIFKVVRALIIGSNFMFEDKLQNISLSASDISLRPELAAGNAAVRTLNINFNYQDNAFDFNTLSYIKTIDFKPSIYYGEDEDA